MTPIQHFISAVSVTVLLLGCASTPDEDPLANANPSAESDGSLSGNGMGSRYGQEGVIKPTSGGIDDSTNPALQRPLDTVIYFEFDSAVLDDTSVQVVNAHAQYLQNNPAARVRLAGHTDERGTREYNIALGERRADTVRRALLLRGVSRSQLTVVSYGEELPAVTGTGENVWAQNRRVEFNYLR